MDLIDESADDYELVHKKITESAHERQIDGKRFVKFEDRRDDSALTKEDVIKHATGKYLCKWRDVPVIKAPLDFMVVQSLLQDLKPATIIETGTFCGGGALWMADLMKTHGVNCHVYSVDISHKLIYPGLKERKDITFIQGDSFKIEEALTPDFLKKLPHPWYVIEDSHVNVTGLLEYFDKFLQPGDYLMVEDIHPLTQNRSGLGLVKDIDYEPVGRSWIFNAYKEFVKKHGSKYQVDTYYTDMFGYNGTQYWDAILKRV